MYISVIYVSSCRFCLSCRQERLRLSVQQVVVQRCCEALPLWDSRTVTFSQGAAENCRVQQWGVLPSQHCLYSPAVCLRSAPLPLTSLTLPQPLTPVLSLRVSVEDMSATSTVSPPPHPHHLHALLLLFLLTPSALSFLKFRSPLVAALACLSASRGGVTRATSSGWSGYFRGSGRKEVALDGDQISKEGESLLKNFPILRMYLRTMAEPVLGVSLEADEGLGAALCGKPVVGMLFSGLQSNVGQAMAAEAFQQALNMGDLNRSLRPPRAVCTSLHSGGGTPGQNYWHALPCKVRFTWVNPVSGTVFNSWIYQFTIKSDKSFIFWMFHFKAKN